MASKTLTALTPDGATATILATDDGAPGVRVTIPQEKGAPLSNWDTVPAWNGIVAGLTDEAIIEHPTVVRLMTAQPHP